MPCRYLLSYSIRQVAERVAKLVLGCILNPNLQKGEVVGVSDSTIWMSDGGFLYALHCDYCDISNHSAAICHRISPGMSLRRKGLTYVSQILTSSERDMRLSNAKETVSISSTVWAQCTNVTGRQTNRPRNGNIDTYRQNRFQRYRLKTNIGRLLFQTFAKLFV